MESLLKVWNAAHFPAQTDFTDGNQFVVDRLVQQRRNQTQTDGKITGCVPQSNAAHNVDIDIQIAEEIACPAFQDSEQQIDAVVVITGAGTPRRRKGSFGGQSLDFTENGPGSFHGAGNTVAGNTHGPTFQKHLGRVGNLGQSFSSHIKHAQFIGGAIAVFCCPQNSIGQHFVSLKIENGIHNVFHDFRPGNCAVFVDMAHQEHRDFLLFGHSQQTSGTLFYLTDGARR